MVPRVRKALEQMDIAIERVTKPTPELRDLIGELDAVLNAATSHINGTA